MVVSYWKMLMFDLDVVFDEEIVFKVEDILFLVMWGMLLEDVILVISFVLVFVDFEDENKCMVVECFFDYMGLKFGMFI